jgi:hypothetical protein
MLYSRIEEIAKRAGFKEMNARKRGGTSFEEGSIWRPIARGAEMVLGTSEGEDVLWFTLMDGVSVEWGIEDVERVFKKLPEITLHVERTYMLGFLTGIATDAAELTREGSNEIAEAMQAQLGARNATKLPPRLVSAWTEKADG